MKKYYSEYGAVIATVVIALAGIRILLGAIATDGSFFSVIKAFETAICGG